MTQKTKGLKRTNHLQVIHRNKTLSLHDAVADLQKLVSQLEQRFEQQVEPQKNKKIRISTAHGMEFIRLSHIIYCEAKGNYAYILILNRAPLLISKTLKAMQKEINDERFIRCHQSYLVNREHVIGHVSCDGAKLNMNQSKLIPVSRRPKKKVLKWLNMH
jgi:two-component system LytT family response regulator